MTDASSGSRFSPLTVIVVGDSTGVQVPRLREALPDADVTPLGDMEPEALAAASAHAHLMLSVGDAEPAGGSDAFFDAQAATTSEVTRFIARARSFDRRRRAHQLPPDTAPIIAPWSPSWVDAAARIGARLAVAFDGYSAEVDHIGSTSVPGLPAKAIIDLQVSVRDLADCDAVDARLKDAGFVDVREIAADAPGVRADNPRSAGLPDSEWEKRLYAGVDAEQRVIVHVRRAGAANWRYALLFRDWLRANAAARDEYAGVKSALAETHAKDAHFDDYARAKDHWFDRAQGESEKWARSTGWRWSPRWERTG